MESNKTYHIKDITFVFLPVFLAAILQYAAVIGDILVLFLRNLISDTRTVRSRSIGTIMTQDFNQPMNTAYVSLAQYTLFILCFGIWYYRSFIKKTNKDEVSLLSEITASFHNLFTTIAPLFLVICGYTGQLFVDGILALCRPIFPNAFAAYDKLLGNVTGASTSVIMMLAVILLAPIGEELLFRGLILKYANRCMPAFVSILLQALLFGLYHGNVIQGIYAFALGIVLGLLAHRYNSILPGILLHVVINLSILFIPKGLFSDTTSCIITTIITFAVFMLSLIWVLRKKKSETRTTDI